MGRSRIPAAVSLLLILITGLSVWAQQGTQETLLQVQHIDENGTVLSTSDNRTTIRPLNLPHLSQTYATPALPGTVQEPAAVPNALAESAIYDNTTHTDDWYAPGRDIEVIDFGTSSGGDVIKFEFGYVTNRLDPGEITIRFYSGTNGSSCPGTYLSGWIFSGLQGSFIIEQTFIVTFEIPANEVFTLPAGDFGYAYLFSVSNRIGVLAAEGGSGNPDQFWEDCVATTFTSETWASFYMKVFAEAETHPVLRIETNTLTFDCDIPAAPASASASMAYETSAAALEDKIMDEEIIRSHFRRGKDKVHVIVNLAEPKTLRLTTNWRSRKSRKVLQTEVASRQQQVFDQLTQHKYKIKNRYKNIAAFSAEVSEKALDRLIKHPRVRSVQPVRTLYPHLNQGLAVLNAISVRGTYSGQGVAVAVCDTGTDYTHPQLGGGGFPNAKVIGGFDVGDNDADPIPQTQNHGSAVSGLAAGDLASFGDYVGGVAHSAKLYALKITSGSGGTASDADMANAWDWCVTHQYDDPNHPIMVINTSFGGGQYFSICDGSFTLLSNAAANAVAAGITVVCSSGNDGYCDSLAFPACLSDAISVGAVYDAAFGSVSWCVSGLSCANIFSTGGCTTGWASTDTSVADKVTVYSNSASFLDLLAPSNQAYTTDMVGNGDDPTGNFTTGFGGTSAASPYVAGVVAALQSAAMDLTGNFLTPDEVRSLLINTGDPVTDPKAGITKPRVNLGNAVESFLVEPEPCSGRLLTLYNDGNATLDIASITTPDWLTLAPQPPFSLDPNTSLELCVTADCNSCVGFDPNDLIQVFNNDPNAFPSMDVPVFMNCPELMLTLTGAVRTVAGIGIAGVQLVADNGGESSMTDPNGFYALTLPLGWSNGTVTPGKQRWSFDPNVVAFAGTLMSDPNAQDYIGKISADFNLDISVDYDDFTELNTHWLRSDCGDAGDPNDPNSCGFADMDLNGIVDPHDLLLFDEQWLNGPVWP